MFLFSWDVVYTGPRKTLEKQGIFGYQHREKSSFSESLPEPAQTQPGISFFTGNPKGRTYSPPQAGEVLPEARTDAAAGAGGAGRSRRRQRERDAKSLQESSWTAGREPRANFPLIQKGNRPAWGGMEQGRIAANHREPQQPAGACRRSADRRTSRPAGAAAQIFR